MIFWLTLIIIWLPITLLFPTKVIGKKNLIKGKCIWACNHQSNVDVMILGTKAFKRIYTLGKAELFKNKFMGGYLKHLGCICVHRGKADITAVKECMRVLKEKQKPLLIFPTGTRTSSSEEVQNLKNGVAMFALKTQSPIVPIVLVRKPKLFRPNRLVIGEPIDITKYLGQKATEDTYRQISEELSQKMIALVEANKYKEKQQKAKKVVNK